MNRLSSRHGEVGPLRLWPLTLPKPSAISRAFKGDSRGTPPFLTPAARLFVRSARDETGPGRVFARSLAML